MEVNMKQISEMTGFSLATVSNALNNKRGVSRETAEKIWKVAREYGYFAGQKIGTIRFVIYRDSGIVVSETPFFSQLIEGIIAETHGSGQEIVISNLNRNEADYQQAREKLLHDSGTAILLLATELTEEEAQPFAASAGPLVMVDSCFDSGDFQSVMIENTDSVCRAVEALIQRGHRNIGYLKSRLRIKNFFYREEGYRRALARHDLPAKPGYAVSLTPTMEGACEDMKEFLKGKPELPTAFFADNDMVALGAMKALQEAGYRIPEDISLVGFDDLPACSVTRPGLSTIRVFKQEMGRIAVRRLNELIQDGGTVKTKIEIGCEYVERESVRSL